jgi:hypothetical protein
LLFLLFPVLLLLSCPCFLFLWQSFSSVCVLAITMSSHMVAYAS